MHADGAKLLNLMFNPGEKVCVSPNQFGYHSVPLAEALSPEIKLVPTEDSVVSRNEKRLARGQKPLTWEQSYERCATDKLLLVALNPLDGYRVDASATAYRSFMVEMDTGNLHAQANYIKESRLPFSACIFSGGKSLHYLITLDHDLSGDKEWRHIAEWILAALPLADQMTKNPSRGIRIPGAYREEKQKFQKLLMLNGRVSQSELFAWLQKYPDAEPKLREKRIRSNRPNLDSVRSWVKVKLLNGLDPTKSRNGQWFAIAYDFSLAGFEESAIIEALAEYFKEDKDFKEREWLTTIRSAVKSAKTRK